MVHPKRKILYKSSIDDALTENAYRADEFLPPILSSHYYFPMLKAFWVMRDLPHQLLLQTDHFFVKRLNIYANRLSKKIKKITILGLTALAW